MKSQRKEATTERSGTPKPCTGRVVDFQDEERLAPDEWKERFAFNLDRLVGLIGLSRKDAALEMNVSYRLLRRIITSGVSRADKTNEQSLERIRGYFALSDVEDLWRPDLVRQVLDPQDGSAFIEKFRERLVAERLRRLAEADRQGEVPLMSRALGIVDLPSRTLSGPYAQKLCEILASSKFGQFKRLIDDYHELITRPGAARSEAT